MTLYCIDTSAWHRSTHPAVATAWRTHLEQDDLGICDQVRLEILWSARSAADYDSLTRELAGLRPIPIDSSTYARAQDVQQRLAHVAGLHHRSVKIPDLLIAAAAEAVEATMLHYDADYDRIAEVTGQAVEWIVERGSL